MMRPGPKARKALEKIQEKVAAQLGRKFDNDMRDMGWDASVGPQADHELSKILINEALPLIEKLAGKAPKKKGRARR